jgi:hypothetical protein
MTMPRSRPLALLAAASGLLVVASAGAHTSPATRSLPPGCGLGIEQQSNSAVAGHTATFTFHGYNAVPPGHGITGVRFSWGDHHSSAGRAKTGAKGPKKGCLDTAFSARHKYTHVTCTGGFCSTDYKVTIRYTDATTKAKHTLRGLSVVVVRGKR